MDPKPRPQPKTLVGLFILVLVVVAVGWAAYEGSFGSSSAVNPISTFLARFVH